MENKERPFTNESTFITMNSPYVIAVVVVLLVAVIVAVDILFFRNLFWERLMANIGIVLVFAAFALRFLRHS
jgi:protein-S-isoprenylcysteine O-methyltransferase Ste14